MGNIGQGILTVVGAVVGSLVPPIGAIRGAAIGLAVGGVLFPAKTKTQDPKPYSDLSVQTSQYGISIPVLFGSRKIAGNLLWYGNFQSHKHEESTGGKGATAPASIYYTYTVSMVFGLCVGELPIKVDRIWAGKDEINYDNTTYRVLDGTQTEPDPHLKTILEAQGKRVPVWKNMCCIVLENYDLGMSPNMPSFNFEVISGAGGTSFVSNFSKIVSPTDTKYSYVYARDLNKLLRIDVKGGIVNGSISISLPGYMFQCLCMDKSNKYVYLAFKLPYGSEVVIVRADISRMGSSCDSNTEPMYVTKSIGDINSVCLDGASQTATDGILGKSYSLWCFASGAVVRVNNDNFDNEESIFDDIGAVLSVCASIDFYSLDEEVAFWVGGNLADGDAIGWINIMDLSLWDVALSSGGGECTDNELKGGWFDHVVAVSGGFYFGASYHPFRGYVYFVDSGLNVSCVTKSSVGYVLESFYDPNEGLFIPTTDVTGSNYAWWRFLGGELVTGWPEEEELQGAWGYNQFTQRPFTIISSFGQGKSYIARWNKNLTLIDRKELLDYSGQEPTPPDVTEPFITNKLFGLGLDSAYIDEGKFNGTRQYCAANDFYVNMLFPSQVSVLDMLQYVIGHHNGYVTFANGKIAHCQLTENDNPVGTISVVQSEDGNDIPVPVSAEKPGYRDYFNKIVVEYIKKDKNYVTGMATDDCQPDIDDYGLRPTTVRLDGLNNYCRAAKMANLILKKNIANPQNIEFKVGPKNIDIAPGQVRLLTWEGMEFDSQPIRIMNVSEGPNLVGEVIAMEEIPEMYHYMSHGSDVSDPGSSPDLREPPSHVIREMIYEIPARYTTGLQVAVIYSRPDQVAWAGASLYKAYAASGGYERVVTSAAAGLTGRVVEIGINNHTAYIDVALDNPDDVFSPATSLDELIINPGKNILGVFVAGDLKALKFEDAELIAVDEMTYSSKWRLSGLIYDLVGIPLLNTSGAISIDDEIFQSNPIVYDLIDSEIGKNIYFKVVSVNAAGIEESIADVDYLTLAVAGVYDKPLTPVDMKVNDTGLPGSSVTIEAGDIALAWVSQNRKTEGISDMTRSDAIQEDSDFESFELTFYNGSTLLRTEIVTVKTFTYTTAMQTTDGGPFSAYTIKIRKKTTKMYSNQVSIMVNTV